MRNQVIGVLAVPFITCAQAQTRAIAPNSPQALAMSRSYGKLPLSFEANRGQTDARVQFLARGVVRYLCVPDLGGGLAS